MNSLNHILQRVCLVSLLGLSISTSFADNILPPMPDDDTTLSQDRSSTTPDANSNNDTSDSISSDGHSNTDENADSAIPIQQTTTTQSIPQSETNEQSTDLKQVMPAAQSQPTTQTKPVTIDCQYRIPAEVKSVDQTVLTTWAKIAATQSFSFNPGTLNQQLEALKACYTEPGWQSFNDALQKSGNLDAIKSQQLTVSSQLNGSIKIDTIQTSQWSITVPMEVVYQNDKEKLMQLLDVRLTVGRKTTGGLGIMQLIATPQKPAAPVRSQQRSNVQAPMTTTNTMPAPNAAPATTPTAATPETTPETTPATTSTSTTTP